MDKEQRQPMPFTEGPTREPDETKDVIIKCGHQGPMKPDPQATGRDYFVVWIDTAYEEFDTREEAERHGRRLAEQHQRALWIDETGYPPTLLWRPAGG